MWSSKEHELSWHSFWGVGSAVTCLGNGWLLWKATQNPAQGGVLKRHRNELRQDAGWGKKSCCFKDGDLHEVQHKWGDAWEASWKSIKVIALKSEQKNHGKKSLNLPKWQQGEWGVWGRRSAKEAPGITPIAQGELFNFLPRWNKNRKTEWGLAVALGTAGPCPWWLQAAPPGPHRPSLACLALRWGLCRGLTVPWAEWENLCRRPAASPEPLVLFLRSLVGGCWSLCSPD